MRVKQKSNKSKTDIYRKILPRDQFNKIEILMIYTERFSSFKLTNEFSGIKVLTPTFSDRFLGRYHRLLNVAFTKNVFEHVTLSGKGSNLNPTVKLL